ncbi:autoantigen p27 domain-containing protein [Methanogenium cariaci]|uniref:autoantigen p27 domain-containing protein n=1 Tax=Methanogenium cariaci TaxID=2197 RepID=UPI00248068C0|nr:autoantigen p27 domain-containing protein [Methanogenium cariaci]
MASYLLTGGRMLSVTCDDCGAPLFEIEGKQCCVVCKEIGKPGGFQKIIRRICRKNRRRPNLRFRQKFHHYQSRLRNLWKMPSVRCVKKQWTRHGLKTRNCIWMPCAQELMPCRDSKNRQIID